MKNLSLKQKRNKKKIPALHGSSLSVYVPIVAKKVVGAYRDIFGSPQDTDGETLESMLKLLLLYMEADPSMKTNPGYWRMKGLQIQWEESENIFNTFNEMDKNGMSDQDKVKLLISKNLHQLN